MGNPIVNILIDNRSNGALAGMLEKRTDWKIENQYVFHERTKNEGFSSDEKYILGQVDQKIILLNKFHEKGIVPYTTQPIIDWNLNLNKLASCVNDLPPLFIVREHVRIFSSSIDTLVGLGPLYYFEVQAKLSLDTDFNQVLIEIFDSIISILGPIDQLSARSRNLRGMRPEPDVMLVTILLRNGIEGHLFINALDGKIDCGDVRLNVYGRDGSFSENITQKNIDIVKGDDSPDYNAYVFLKWIDRACRSETLVYLKDLNC